MLQRSMLLLTLALAGCATNAQRQSSQIGETLRAANQQSTICFNAVTENPNYREIQSRILSPAIIIPPMDRLADREKPSENMRRSLMSFHADVSPCRQAYIQAVGQISQELVVAINNYYARNDQNYLSLIQGRVSWGEANQSLAESGRIYRAESQGIFQQISARLNSQHSAEIEQRQRAAAAIAATGYAMQQQAIQQQMLNAINRPVTTNCVRSFNTVNCTSN